MEANTVLQRCETRDHVTSLDKSLGVALYPARWHDKTSHHNSADSVPISNFVCIKEVDIRTTFSCWNNLLHLQLSYWNSMYPLQKCFQQTFLTNCESK